ncbi:MAG TPA: DUF3053 family protein [Stellaceae bacterium]
MGFTRTSARAACFILLIAFTAGCDDEASQRKAFIDYLQARIVDKPSLHVPHPTEAETRSFGPYAKDYQIILDFNDGLSRTVSAGPMEAVMTGNLTPSLGEAVKRRADLAAVRDGLTQLHDALLKALATADASHAALKQPDDLKAVYDKAYTRAVTVPAKTFDEIFPAAIGAFGNILTLADFVAQHPGKVTVIGPVVEVTDPALRPQLKQLLDKINAGADAIAQAQRKMQAVADGT